MLFIAIATAHQFITHPIDRLNELWFFWIILQLAPQIFHMSINGSLITIKSIVLNFLDNLQTAQNAPAVYRK